MHHADERAAERTGMTARRVLRWALLAALLCMLLVSAALAADSTSDTPVTPSNTVDDALGMLDDAVAARQTSFFVYLPDGTSSTRGEYMDQIQAHILNTWIDVSPRVAFSVSSSNYLLEVKLRYASATGDYDKALAEAFSACIRSGMTALEKTMSIYSWLANTLVPTASCDTAYEALVDGKADCFGFAGAFRAVAEKAGLTCTVVRGTYGGAEHAWNTVKIGGNTYYVDVSRGDCAWSPGHVDYTHLLFGTNKSDYSAEVTGVSAEGRALDFRRNGICTPLMLKEDGFWFILGTKLHSVPYGKDFSEAAWKTLGKLLADGTFGSAIQAAAEADGVVYYSLSLQNDTRLYSLAPGMPEAETRETGLSGTYGLRLEGRTLQLMQNGTAAKTMPLRRYSDVTKPAYLACDADAVPGTLSGANIRLLGQTDGAQLIAAFYDGAGRMLAAQVVSAAAPDFRAPPSGCTQVRLFAVSAAAQPIAQPLTIPTP